MGGTVYSIVRVAKNDASVKDENGPLPSGCFVRDMWEI